MNPVAELVGRFGGKTAMAKALNHRHCTTVQGWEKAGRIPHWRKDEVMAAASRCGTEIPADVIEAAFNDQAAE